MGKREGEEGESIQTVKLLTKVFSFTFLVFGFSSSSSTVASSSSSFSSFSLLDASSSSSSIGSSTVSVCKGED